MALCVAGNKHVAVLQQCYFDNSIHQIHNHRSDRNRLLLLSGKEVQTAVLGSGLATEAALQPHHQDRWVCQTCLVRNHLQVGARSHPWFVDVFG